MRTVNQIRAHRDTLANLDQNPRNIFDESHLHLMRVYVEDVTNLLDRLDNPRPLPPHQRILRLKKLSRLNRRRPRKAAAERLMAHGSMAHATEARTEKVDWLKGNPERPQVRRSDGSWPEAQELEPAQVQAPTLFGSSL